MGVYVARAPSSMGQVALDEKKKMTRATSASTGNEDLGEMCLHGTGICSPLAISFVFMTVNRNLRSMTIRVPDHDPRYENHNITSGSIGLSLSTGIATYRSKTLLSLKVPLDIGFKLY